MKAVLFSLVVVLAALSVASAHVIAIYNGMDLPIRGATTATSDGTASVAGPCSGSTTFGANGITEIVPGKVINLQLKYQQPHPNGAMGNWFTVGMICKSGDPATLGSDTSLRLYDTANGVQTNMVNNAGVSPISIPAQDVTAIPFTFPSKSPAGLSLSAGDHCVVSIMDTRNWGGCIDFKVASQPGPIVAGVVTPAVGVGAAAAIFFARGTIAAKLTPTAAAAAPEKRMWRGIFLAFVTMILTIVATATPSWSVGNGFTSGPWALCPDNRDCYDPVISGIAGIYAVRVFSLSAVFAAIIALALPVLVHYNRVDASQAAKSQIWLFAYVGAAAFAAVMVWSSILLAGAALGGALIVEMIVCVFGFIGATMAYVWWKAIEVAPKNAPLSTSGPIIASAAVSVPVSYPSAHGSGPKSYASHASPKAAGGYPPVKQSANPSKAPGKWGDWEEMYDEENSAYYFFNHSNGESLWEAPEGWPHPARV
jgi:hypothetical protein